MHNVAQVNCPTILEQEGARRRAGDEALLHLVNGVEGGIGDWRWIGCWSNLQDAGHIQRQVGRAGVILRLEQAVEQADRAPVVAPGRLVGEGGIAVIRPAHSSVELAVRLIAAVGVAHCAGAGLDRLQDAAGAQAEIVVIEIQGVVAEFMGQGARPVFAQAAAGGAVAVPHRAEMDLPRPIGDGDNLCVSDHFGDDAALQGHRAQVVAGVDADVSVVPALAVLVKVNVAQRRLAVRPIVKQFGGALQVALKLLQIGGIVAGVPLQRDIQVEQQQRVGGRDGESLHAVRGNGVVVQIGVIGRSGGVVERVGVCDHRWPQGDQAVAAVQFAVSEQVASAVGMVRLAAGVSRRDSCGASISAFLQAVDCGLRGRGCAVLVHHPYLRAAHAEGEGRCGGIGMLEKRRAVEVLIRPGGGRRCAR